MGRKDKEGGSEGGKEGKGEKKKGVRKIKQWGISEEVAPTRLETIANVVFLIIISEYLLIILCCHHFMAGLVGSFSLLFAYYLIPYFKDNLTRTTSIRWICREHLV